MRLHLLPGDKFGRLTLSNELPKDSRGRRRWLCQCDCGGQLEVLQGALRSGNTASCGCIRRESLIARQTTHGKSNTDEFRIWKGMVKRCYNPNAVGYENYGGRGISVSDEWRNDFMAFLGDVGGRPSPQHSLDRFPNLNGNYERGNVRWATPTEQSRNTRRNVLITIEGRTMVLEDWVREFGSSRKLVEGRIKSGWPARLALASPLGSRLHPGKWSPARRAAHAGKEAAA